MYREEINMNLKKLNIIDNFISRETSYYIHNYLKTKTHIHYPDENHPNGLKRCAIYFNGASVFDKIIKESEQKVFPGDLEKDNKIVFDLLNLIKNSVESKFNLPKDQINILGMSYTHYGITQSLPSHNDWGVSKHHVYSAILYLTDDYEGGEFIWYDNYNPNTPETNTWTASKPSSGQLYYFEGTQDAHHEVAAVTSGERSCIVFFYTGINFK
jgi:hypothetical protein